MPNKCDNVISLKQYGPTCWFNSILMSILYSDESRKLLLEKSKNWDKNIIVYETIYHILKNKYLRSDNVYDDYTYFDKIRPETILKQLYAHNNKKFPFDPEKYKNNGYKSALYIRKVYKLLGVKVLYLDKIGSELYYSIYNNITLLSLNNGDVQYRKNFKELSTIIKSFHDPDVIIVNSNYYGDTFIYPERYNLNSEMFKKTFMNEIKNINHKDFLTQINDLKSNINYNNEEYIQDSILLTNWNDEHPGIGGHSITGITCKGDKYVYNGWTRTTIDANIGKNSKLDDKIPCELMRFDWDLHKRNNDFCLNSKKCVLDIMDLKTRVQKLCFSFNSGVREIIYVKKNKNSNLNIKQNNDCDIENVINPLTNRCIKIKSINKLPSKPLSKPEIAKKICPKGTILNPLTNRCNKIKTVIKKIDKPKKKDTSDKKIVDKVVKICPEGTVLNPKTNRCNKIKIDKSNKQDKKIVAKVVKICPEGTVLNPKTNRCNKIKK